MFFKAKKETDPDKNKRTKQESAEQIQKEFLRSRLNVLQAELEVLQRQHS